MRIGVLLEKILSSLGTRKKEIKMEKRLETRIRILKQRPKDNYNIVRKLERKLRKLKESN